MAMTLRLALLLVVASPVVALVQPGSAVGQTPASTIHGWVFAADDRAPLPRARVTTIVDGEAGPPVYTDDRGRFEIARPSASTFTLSVVKARYAPQLVFLRTAAFTVRSAPDVSIALTRSAAVNGRIVDTTGETVVGLPVYADRLDPDAAAPERLLKFATTTDDRGEYRLGGLPPGRYSVTAPGAQDPGAVEMLVLRPGDDIANIDFVAQPPPATGIEPSPQPPETRDGATIRGRVLTTSGRPIAQAVVSISGPMPPRYVVTDAQGHFSFPGLIAGDYVVLARKGDFLPPTLDQRTSFESSRRIAVDAGARVNDVALVLSRGFAVSGTIVDRAGEPLHGVSVQALRLSTSGERARAAVAGALVGGIRETDDRGRYRVLGLQPGTYVIAALADAGSLGAGATAAQSVPIYFPGSAVITDAVTVTIAATDVDAVDFTVGDVATARVTGVAVDSTGAPLDGTVTLAVSHRSGTIVPNPRTIRIGADGAFTFFNVAPGDYVVQASKLPFVRDVQSARSADPLEAFEFATQYVTVAAHDAEPVSLHTARGAVMEGRIITDGPVGQDPYGRLQIEAYPIGFDFAPISGSLGGMRRMVDGRFRITGLTGPRRVALSGMPDGWYLKSVTVNGSEVTDDVIDFGVGSGGSVAADIVIAANGGSVVGRLTRGRTAGNSGASVIVFPEDRAKWFERSRFIKVVRVSPEGSFRAASLPPGDYHVAASAITDEFEATTPDALERLLVRAPGITLNEGEERPVDVSLP